MLAAKRCYQVGFSGKLVRKFLLRRHGRGMGARRLGESFIFLQRRKPGFGSFAVRHVQKLAFRFGVVIGEGCESAAAAPGCSRRVQWRHLERHDASRKNNRQRSYEGTGHMSFRFAQPDGCEIKLPLCFPHASP